MSRRYALVRPCPKCPFRTDVPPYLTEGRAAEIASTVQEGAEFWCHETTVPDPDDESGMTEDEASMVCAGSLILMEKAGTPNQMMRIAERIGAYDRARLDIDAPVPSSWSEWQRRFRPDDEEVEPCNVVGPDCEAPAGYATSGGVVEGTESAGYECSDCGAPVCGPCSVVVARYGDDVLLCGYCAEEEEG